MKYVDLFLNVVVGLPVRVAQVFINLVIAIVAFAYIDIALTFVAMGVWVWVSFMMALFITPIVIYAMLRLVLFLASAMLGMFQLFNLIGRFIIAYLLESANGR